MANQTGRPVASARKLIAAVLGTIAAFVMVFGLGRASWAIVALGGAMLALAVVLSMANVMRRGERTWVVGQGLVKAISELPLSSAYGRAEIQLTVVAPGLSTADVLIRDPRVPVAKWPRPGDTLPITVDLLDIRRVRIDWSQAADQGESGDPPPPEHYEPAEEYLDDDLLGTPEPPPWTTRDRVWGRGPEEPQSPSEDLILQRPIVVRDTPGGPVLEGQFEAHDDVPRVLPQRARQAETVNAASQTRTRPSPRPRQPTTSSGTTTGAPTTTETSQGAVPEQRTAGNPDAGPWSQTPAASQTATTTEASEPAPATREPATASSATTAAGASEPASARSGTAAPDRATASSATAGPEPATASSTTTAAGASEPATTRSSTAARTPEPTSTSPAAAATDVTSSAAAGPATGTTGSHAYTGPTTGNVADKDDDRADSGARSAGLAAGLSQNDREATDEDRNAPPSAEERSESAGIAAEEPHPYAGIPAPRTDQPQAHTPTAPRPGRPTPSDEARTEPPPPTDHDIDLPLDGDPEPPPEFRPRAQAAMASGLIAPPVEAEPSPAKPIPTQPGPASQPAAETHAAATTRDQQPGGERGGDDPRRPGPAPHATSGAHAAGTVPAQSTPRPTSGIQAAFAPAKPAPHLDAPTSEGSADRAESAQRPTPGSEPTARAQAASRPASNTEASGPAESSPRAAPTPAKPAPHTTAGAHAAGTAPAESAPRYDTTTPTGQEPAAVRPPERPIITGLDEETPTVSTEPTQQASRNAETAQQSADAKPTQPSAEARSAQPSPEARSAQPSAEAEPAQPPFARAEPTQPPSRDAEPTQPPSAGTEPAQFGPAAPEARDDRPGARSTGPVTATLAGAGFGIALGAAANDAESNRVKEGAPSPRGPWADLEGGYEPDERADDLITAYPSARPGPAGAIHGIGITILVTDMDRSITFYRDTLGFFEIDSGHGSAVLASGDTRLVLRTVHALAGELGRPIHLNLEVGDVEAVYQELLTKNVRFQHAPRVVNRGDKLELWAATFHDPDGHSIAITQWRATR